MGGELKTLERGVQPTEPYQMPCLGVSYKGKNRKGSKVSALSVLSQSAAYKSLQEKVYNKQENEADYFENKNKNIISKMDYGKAIEKPTSHHGGNERLGVALGMTGGLSLQRNMFALTPLLSAPLLTSYNSMDPLADPILWTSLAPVASTGTSSAAEVGIYHDLLSFSVFVTVSTCAGTCVYA